MDLDAFFKKSPQEQERIAKQNNMTVDEIRKFKEKSDAICREMVSNLKTKVQ